MYEEFLAGIECLLTASLQIRAEIKAIQTVAVVCSILKYFTYAILGVARVEDERFLKAEVSEMTLLCIHCLKGFPRRSSLQWVEKFTAEFMFISSMTC